MAIAVDGCTTGNSRSEVDQGDPRVDNALVLGHARPAARLTLRPPLQSPLLGAWAGCEAAGRAFNVRDCKAAYLGLFNNKSIYNQSALEYGTTRARLNRSLNTVIY